MEQNSIFDENFDKPELLRRLDLLPAWLKVYTWITLGLSVFMTILIFLQIPDTAGNLDAEDAAGFWAGTMLAATFIAAVYLSPVLLVLFEIKWAIGFNLVIGVLWLALISSLALLLDVTYLYLAITMCFYIPLWAGLLPLRRRWTKEAVSGRALRKKTRVITS
nr:hypothetical protein [uncultured Chitinophaga sp.]